MYAIQVEPGKERIRVRHYTNGFLPSYRPADEGGAGRKLVVPGYIFMLTKVPGAVKVPDSDWKVIEAISDTHASTISDNWKTISAGPLQGLLILRVNQKQSSVLIRAKLLGITRDYWLKVEPELLPKTDDEHAAPVIESMQQKKQTEEAEMAENKAGKKAEKKTYTEEEIQAALKKADEVGIHAAGKELDIPWQAILGWAKKANPDRVPVKKAEKKEKKEKQEKAAVKAKGTKPAKIKLAAKKAEAEATVEKTVETTVEKAVEQPARRKPGRPKKAAAEKTVKTEKTEEKKKVLKAPVSSEEQLKIENAVLKEKIAKLETQVDKLKKAIADLMQ